MKGDIQKVIEIKEKWTKKEVKQLRHAKSIDMSSQNYKEFDLPHLRINYTQIEKNRLIQLKRRIVNTESNTSLQSDDYNISPQRYSKGSALSQCLLPSNQFTKKQNIKILDQLYESVKTLKESNSQQQEKLIQKLLNTRNASRQKESQKLNTFITSPQNRSIFTEINITQQSQLNESIQLLNKIENKQSGSKSLIERQVINQDGSNYPFNLYVINKTRQQYLDTVTDNQNRKRSLDQYGNQQENHVQRIKRQFESSIEESELKGVNFKNSEKILYQEVAATLIMVIWHWVEKANSRLNDQILNFRQIHVFTQIQIDIKSVFLSPDSQLIFLLCQINNIKMSNQDIVVMDDSDSDTSIIDVDEQEFQTDIDPVVINQEIDNTDLVENVQKDVEQQEQESREHTQEQELAQKQQHLDEHKYVEQLHIPTLNINGKQEQAKTEQINEKQNKKASRECDIKAMFHIIEQLNFDSKLKITNLLYRGSMKIHSQLIKSIQNLGNQSNYF